MRTLALLLPALLCLASPARSHERIPINPFGLDDSMIGRPAPELEISEWTREFAGEKDVEFVSVHTVFEGFLFQFGGKKA